MLGQRRGVDEHKLGRRISHVLESVGHSGGHVGHAVGLAEELFVPHGELRFPSTRTIVSLSFSWTWTGPTFPD